MSPNRQGRVHQLLPRYATDVFRASDDLPMAFHYAGHVIATGNARPDFDRRWAGG